MNLPKVNKAHKQERRSITQFRVIMEGDDFIVRDYRESDYGVDLVLELIIGNGRYASNYKSDIQLKDRIDSDSIRNKNGSYTYQISISNINYLSNSPNSLFVIYLEDKNIFVWEWIYEIEKMAINDGINCKRWNT